METVSTGACVDMTLCWFSRRLHSGLKVVGATKNATPVSGAKPAGRETRLAGSWRRQNSTVEPVSGGRLRRPEDHSNQGTWWQGRRESNPRPSVLETGALPIELHPSRPVHLAAALGIWGFTCSPYGCTAVRDSVPAAGARDAS